MPTAFPLLVYIFMFLWLVLAEAAILGAARSTSNSVLVIMILIFLGLVSFVVLRDLGGRKIDVFEIKYVFLLFYVLYSLSVPIRSLFEPLGTEERGLIVHAFGLCLAGLLSFLVGYLIRYRIRRGQGPALLPLEWDPSATRKVALGVIFGGLTIYLLAIQLTCGIRVYFSAGYGGRGALKAEYGPLDVGLYIALIGICLYWTYRLITHQGGGVFFWGSLAGFIFLMTIIGIRRPTFWILLTLMALYHYLGRRLSLSKSVFLVLILGIGFTLFAFVRHITGEGDVFGGFRYLRDNFSWSWLDVSRTELGAPFKSLTMILSRVPNPTPYFDGQSYVDAILYQMPRFIYPNRPVSISGWFEREFFSEKFVAEGGSMGVFMVAEAFANFGDYGVVIIMFLWGVLFRWFYELFLRHRESPAYVFFYVMSLAWVVFLMRLDFAGAVKGYLVTALIPAFPAMLAAGRKHRKA